MDLGTPSSSDVTSYPLIRSKGVEVFADRRRRRRTREPPTPARYGPSVSDFRKSLPKRMSSYKQKSNQNALETSREQDEWGDKKQNNVDMNIGVV
ncbi:hypothetical protein EVAR_86212_1 [Eumeta japonica]|uniref:Uncharacterized protein n=1 Tax=Eumeta variegata TaxID=151549 RepID=A0A4C1UD16_EUMVA|nr:hypothetical protein EVAR_86212_1 [Eumeta japonica]